MICLRSQLVGRWRRALPAAVASPAGVGSLRPVGDGHRSIQIPQAPGHIANGLQRRAPAEAPTVPTVVETPCIRRRSRHAVRVEMRIIRQAGVQSPYPFFTVRHRGGQARRLVRDELLPHLLRRHRATAPILRLAEELDGMNPRQHSVRVEPFNWLEAVEQLERIPVIKCGVVRVAAHVANVPCVDVHAHEGLQERLHGQRIPSVDVGAHPSAADVEPLSLDAQIRP